MHMLSEGHQGWSRILKIRQSDRSMFDVGKNLGTTPGKVVFQNELMQLIQYEATTKHVLKLPLLIIPPWINKFYIWILRPKNPSSNGASIRASRCL
jgi:polyhydroxyalkanoate synthase